jgi:hypothetical protein
MVDAKRHRQMVACGGKGMGFKVHSTLGVRAF